jgi:hypothetical protein
LVKDPAVSLIRGDAYQGCALEHRETDGCTLRERELVQAAQIVPEAEAEGVALPRARLPGAWRKPASRASRRPRTTPRSTC